MSQPGPLMVVLAGGGFTPTSIAGMRFWQEATAITGKNVGDPLPTWADTSGAGNDLTEATNPPSYRATDGPNGLPCVRFDGVNDKLSKTPLAGDTSFTVFIVAKKRSVPVGTQTLWNNTSASSAQLHVSAGSNVYKWYANQAAGFQTLTGDCTVWAILVVRVNSASSVDVYVSGGTATNFDPADTVTTGNVRNLGQEGGSNPGDWDVYGHLEWDSALTAANVNVIGAWLGAKTAIAWTTAT